MRFHGQCLPSFEKFFVGLLMFINAHLCLLCCFVGPFQTASSWSRQSMLRLHVLFRLFRSLNCWNRSLCTPCLLAQSGTSNWCFLDVRDCTTLLGLRATAVASVEVQHFCLLCFFTKFLLKWSWFKMSPELCPGACLSWRSHLLVGLLATDGHRGPCGGTSRVR